MQTADEIKRSHDEKYMAQCPSRAEVTVYMKSIMEQEILPVVQAQVQEALSGSRLSAMVLQAILLNKGIVTEEELEQAILFFSQQMGGSKQR